MMPVDVLVNIVMPEVEWHFDDFNMLICIYIHSTANLCQKTPNLTELHIKCFKKKSIGSQIIPRVTTNMIQIVSICKHSIVQIFVLTFQPHQPLHINVVFCNMCRLDATTKRPRRNKT